jgi:2,4-dichlorophenol 6-monooxygenase
VIQTDVLIVGSGPAGSAAALMLSTYGIANIVVTRYRWLADTPRAHFTNQRTMEILRDLDVEQEAIARATPQQWLGDTVFCTSLAGDEIGRIRTWGTDPLRSADHALGSPSSCCDLPQNLLEPILLGNAASRGSHVRFDTEYLSHEQDADGVTATVRDRLSGLQYQIRAQYLIGADGSRSKVAEDIGLPMQGHMGVAGSMNIVFDADLSRYVAHRPGLLYWVLQPGSNIGGIGMGLIRMVRPWSQWMIVWGFDIDQPPPVIDDVAATAIVRRLIGDADVPVTIRSTSLWSVNDMYATQNTVGRIFCMGDAVHRHPPSNGLGSNTSIQDAYNLCWKLAAVLKGMANPRLLETYDVERSPVAKQIVKRANQSIREFRPIFDALGLLDTADVDKMQANMAARRHDTLAAATQRQKLREAIALKSYEFDTHGVEMNQRYRSAAVVSDGTDEPAWERDQELYYHATTWPGARLPHAWLTRGGHRVSTLDLAGKMRFVLLTGIGGDPWIEAIRHVRDVSGVPIEGFVIGPGHPLEDPYGEWARAREIDEAGCILVRPDAHVAWRGEGSANAGERLLDALLKVLCRKGD